MLKNIIFITLTAILPGISGITRAQVKTKSVNKPLNQYSLQGTVKGTEKNKKVQIYVSRYGSYDQIDSALVVNGSYSITSKINEPEWVNIFYRTTYAIPGRTDSTLYSHAYYCFIEKGKLNFSFTMGDIENGKFTGSPISDEKLRFEKANSTVLDSITSLTFRYFSTESKLEDTTNNKEVILKELATLDHQISGLDSVKEIAVSAHIKQYPGSFYSLWMLSYAVQHGMQVETSAPLFSILSPALKKTAIGKELNEKVGIDAQFQIGRTAPDFTLTDSTSTPFVLSAQKGKYLLVDFWASWCVPCRAENPAVRKAYADFKDNGFDIVSISVDSTKEPWLKAVKEDQLAWKNLRDQDQEVSKLYHISAIPSNFLLDPEGKIVARNLRGKDLDQKLSEIFSKK